jgi:hypothetical protein
MKKHVVTASLLAGFSMISGTAFAQTGTVGAGVSHVDTDFGNADSYNVNGGAAFQMGGNLAVLVDAGYSSSDDTNTDVLTGTGHLISRDANGAFGGFVGLGNVDAGGGGVDLWTAGGEYAAFYDNSTFVATVAYANADDVNVDIWGLSGEYRMFMGNNLRFDLGAGYARIDSGANADAFQVGAGVEYRFEGTPFSLGGNIAYVDLDGGGDATIVGATLKFDFGNDSLKSRDRTGNTFGSFGGLATYLN